MAPPPLTYAEIHELTRWNTPTIYNGWEQIQTRRRARLLQPRGSPQLHAQMPPMCGWAVTVVIQPSERRHTTELPTTELPTTWSY